MILRRSFKEVFVLNAFVYSKLYDRLPMYPSYFADDISVLIFTCVLNNIFYDMKK